MTMHKKSEVQNSKLIEQSWCFPFFPVSVFTRETNITQYKYIYIYEFVRQAYRGHPQSLMRKSTEDLLPGLWRPKESVEDLELIAMLMATGGSVSEGQWVWGRRLKSLCRRAKGPAPEAKESELEAPRWCPRWKWQKRKQTHPSSFPLIPRRPQATLGWVFHIPECGISELT